MTGEKNGQKGPKVKTMINEQQKERKYRLKKKKDRMRDPRGERNRQTHRQRYRVRDREIQRERDDVIKRMTAAAVAE